MDYPSIKNQYQALGQIISKEINNPTNNSILNINISKTNWTPA